MAIVFIVIGSTSLIMALNMIIMSNVLDPLLLRQKMISLFLALLCAIFCGLMIHFYLIEIGVGS